MSKEMEYKMVPRLRFPEFREAEEWVDTSVEKNCLVKGRIGYRGYTSEDLVEKDKGALVLGGKHIQNQVIDLSEPTFLSWDKYYESPEIIVGIGDIIFSQRGTLGDCAIIEKEIGPATINPSMVVLKNITCNPKFLYYILIGDSIQKEVQKNKALGAIPMLSQKQIKEFTFPIPDNPKEQQKIADCLSSLDDLIAAQSQKLDALKTHKKGLMKQLFPAEGETVPRLRFPEFRDDGDWELKQLGEIAENLDFRRVPITSTDRVKGIIPYYGASGIIDYVNDHIFNEDLLCISEDGANLVMRTYPIAFPITGKAWVNNHAHVLKFENKFTQVIVEKYLNAINIEDFLTGMAQPKLNRGKLDIIPIPLPGLSEQQKIADFLSALDDLISAQSQKLEALRAHKKGLMQQLFPNPNNE